MDPNTFYFGNVSFKIGPRYKPVSYIGGGGYGQVIEVIDTENNEHFAVKKLH